ncbi:MAG: DUF2231 domain-containing protein [Candidatus Andeanibacterium colombiense]|uniref:DUF2231 domain-containing protein n=1 Tax=Candidatus Andeanibacterium colombiense TaxID=3121345 RepID=A0AAJ5X6Y8_9SPHN|nr:MAG: DUF2231 domain-containing protein [Sphingomonadaceae bacterium]
MARIFQPTVRIARVPLHAMLVPFPIACFTGAMITDIVHSRTGVMQWSNFSAWLLAFGLLFGVLAGLFGLIDFLLGGRARPRIGWFHLLGNAAILLLALLNSFVHARDGWTSVVPTGLTLSVITVLLLVVTGFLGHRMTYAYVGRERP